MALEQSIAELVTATNTLTQQVIELMGDVDDRISQKLEDANIQQIISDLLESGEVPVTVDPEVLSQIISEKIASGELGTQATTLGGKPASAYALKTDLNNYPTKNEVAQGYVPRGVLLDLGVLPE